MNNWKLLLLVPCAGAMMAQPHITAVVSAADLRPGIAWNGLGVIVGNNLADDAYKYDSLPYPPRLGTTEAFLCLPGRIVEIHEGNCAPLGLVSVSPAQIRFQMLESLPNIPGFGGGLSVVVRVNGQIDDGATAGTSAGTQVTQTVYGGNPSFLLPQPRIFSAGYDCLTDTRYQDANKNCGLSPDKPATYSADRGIVLDEAGRVLSSDNPARIGGTYAIVMTGLGRFANGKPANPLTMNITNVPVYGYPGDTYIRYGALENITASPETPGVYQVRFKLTPLIMGSGVLASDYPPQWPCGSYRWELSLDIGQRNAPANLVQIPVAIAPEDPPCNLTPAPEPSPGRLLVTSIKLE